MLERNGIKVLNPITRNNLFVPKDMSKITKFDLPEEYKSVPLYSLPLYVIKEEDVYYLITFVTFYVLNTLAKHDEPCSNRVGYYHTLAVSRVDNASMGSYLGLRGIKLGCDPQSLSEDACEIMSTYKERFSLIKDYIAKALFSFCIDNSEVESIRKMFVDGYATMTANTLEELASDPNNGGFEIEEKNIIPFYKNLVHEIIPRYVEENAYTREIMFVYGFGATLDLTIRNYYSALNLERSGDLYAKFTDVTADITYAAVKVGELGGYLPKGYFPMLNDSFTKMAGYSCKHIGLSSDDKEKRFAFAYDDGYSFVRLDGDVCSIDSICVFNPKNTGSYGLTYDIVAEDASFTKFSLFATNVSGNTTGILSDWMKEPLKDYLRSFVKDYMHIRIYDCDILVLIALNMLDARNYLTLTQNALTSDITATLNYSSCYFVSYDFTDELMHHLSKGVAFLEDSAFERSMYGKFVSRLHRIKYAFNVFGATIDYYTNREHNWCASVTFEYHSADEHYIYNHLDYNIDHVIFRRDPKANKGYSPRLYDSPLNYITDDVKAHIVMYNNEMYPFISTLLVYRCSSVYGTYMGVLFILAYYYSVVSDSVKKLIESNIIALMTNKSLDHEAQGEYIGYWNAFNIETYNTPSLEFDASKVEDFLGYLRDEVTLVTDFKEEYYSY